MVYIEWIPLLSNLFCSVFQFCPITAVATSIPSLCPKLHSSQVDVNLQLPGFFENMKIILLDHDTFGSLRGSTVGNQFFFNGKMLLRKSSMVDIPMLSGTDYQATVGQKSAAVTFWTQKKRDESRCGVYPRPKPIPDPCIKFYMCSGPNAINHPPNQHFWWYKLSPTVGLWDWVYHRTGTVSNSPWIFCAGKFPQREDFAAKGQKLISRKKRKVFLYGAVRWYLPHISGAIAPSMTWGSESWLLWVTLWQWLT